MKAYLAGKLGTKGERSALEEIDEICKSLGLDTFLPHREVGLAKGIEDTEKIFQGDIIEGFKDCTLVVVSLDGLHVGAGTAWELGYAYAKNIPIIGIKMDEPVKDAFEYLSAILIGSIQIVTSLEELKSKITEIISQEA